MNSILSSNSKKKRISRKPTHNPMSPDWKFSRLRCKSDQCLPMNYISPKKKKQKMDLSSLIKSNAQSKLISLVQENQQLKEIVEILQIENQQFSQELEVYKITKKNFCCRPQTKDVPQSNLTLGNQVSIYGERNSCSQIQKIKSFNDSTCLQSKILRNMDSNIPSSTNSNLAYLQDIKNQRYSQGNQTFDITVHKYKQKMRYQQVQEESEICDQTEQKICNNRGDRNSQFSISKQGQSSQMNNFQTLSTYSNCNVLQLQSLVKIDEESSQLNILDLTQNNIQAQSILRVHSKRSRGSGLPKIKQVYSHDLNQSAENILIFEQQDSIHNFNQTYSFQNANGDSLSWNCKENILQVPTFIKQSQQSSIRLQKKNERKYRMKSRLMQQQNRQYFQTKDKQKLCLEDKVTELSDNLRQANKTIAKLRVQLDSANINMQVLQHKIKVKDRLLENLKARECQRVLFQMSDGFNQTMSIINPNQLNQNYHPSMKQQSIAERCEQLLSTYQVENGKKLIENIKMKMSYNHQRTHSTDNGGFGIRSQDRNKLKTMVKTKHDVLKNSMDASKSNSIISNFRDLCKQSYKNSITSKMCFPEDLDQSLQMYDNKKQLIEDTLCQEDILDSKYQTG